MACVLITPRGFLRFLYRVLEVILQQSSNSRIMLMFMHFKIPMAGKILGGITKSITMNPIVNTTTLSIAFLIKKLMLVQMISPCGSKPLFW